MASNKSNRLWTLVIIFLLVVIVTGGIVIWSKYSPEQPLEISIAQPAQQSGQIYIGGAVYAPGLYPFRSDEKLNGLLRAAGGVMGSANFSGIELYIPVVGEGQGEQKIDINRAEVWLLEALPDIGETLAKRIVDYRQKNGLFSNTEELLKVPGIGATTYEKIKDLITVAAR